MYLLATSAVDWRDILGIIVIVVICFGLIVGIAENNFSPPPKV